MVVGGVLFAMPCMVRGWAVEGGRGRALNCPYKQGSWGTDRGCVSLRVAALMGVRVVIVQ
jgi:hypothetical protein